VRPNPDPPRQTRSGSRSAQPLAAGY